MTTRPEPWMMTVGLRLTDEKVCLMNLGRYLETDDKITGIKYKYKTNTIIKGNYITSISKRQAAETQTMTRAFNNQVSLQINLDNTTASVKIFQNGNMHMSGIKTLEQSIQIKSLVIDRINELYDKYDTVLVSTVDGLKIDSDNILYSPSNKIFGYMDRGSNTCVVNGNKYTYDKQKGYFISDLVKRKRVILNAEGTVIGYKQLVLNKGNTRIYKNNKQIIEKDDCIMIGDNVIGVYKEHVSADVSADVSVDTSNANTSRVMQYNKKVCEKLVNESTVDDVEVYTMFLKYNIGKTLQKTRLTEILQEYNFLLNKTSLKQSKVELVYKHNPNNSTPGICDCAERCTCKNINFIFFETGKVSVYGIKSTSEYSIIERVNGIIERMREPSFGE